MAMMTPQMNNYLASQQKRLADAQKSNNKDLVSRLTNDIARFNKYTPLKTTKPTLPYVANTNNIVNYDSLDKSKDYVGKAIQNMNQTVSNAVDRVQETNNRNQFVPKNESSNIDNNKMDSSNNSPNEFNYDPTTDKRYANYFQPQQAFNYDPKSDPLYQSMLQNALSQARANAKVASQNALELLNDRGISNSSITQNQLAQIEQNALTGAESQLNSSLLPQLMNQAYQRYQDDISNRNNQFNMDRSLTGDAYQRFLDSISNKRADKQLLMQEADLTGVYNGNKTQSALNNEVNQKMNEAGLTGLYNGQKTLDAQKFDQSQKQFEFDKTLALKQDTEENRRWLAEWKRAGEEKAKQLNLEYAQLNQREKERISDQAMKEKNYQLDLRQQNWSESVDNPLNQQREANASTKSEPSRSDFINTKTKAYLDSVDTGETTYEDALNELRKSVISNELTQAEANQIISAMDQYGLKPQPTDWKAIGNKVSPFLTIPSIVKSASSTLIPGLGKALKPFINK